MKGVPSDQSLRTQLTANADLRLISSYHKSQDALCLTWALIPVAGQCLGLVLDLALHLHHLPSLCLTVAAGTPICPLTKVTFCYRVYWP